MSGTPGGLVGRLVGALVRGVAMQNFLIIIKILMKMVLVLVIHMNFVMPTFLQDLYPMLLMKMIYVNLTFMIVLACVMVMDG